MDGKEVRKIRKKLELTKVELASFLSLSGYQSVSNIETDFRKPSKFTAKFLRYLNGMTKTKALALIEEINKHEV